MGKSKKVVTKEKITGGKTPVIQESPESYLKKRPSWRFNRCDESCNGKWCVKSHNEFTEILSKLEVFEKMTWDEINKDSRNNNNKHHFIARDKWIKEAQKRADELKLFDYDQLFSFALDGKRRLWGILEDGVFTIVWYDPKHEICPSNKKHT